MTVLDRRSFWDLCTFTDKQLEATHAAMAHKYTLYGGSRGPGKSYWLRWYLLWLLIYFADRLGIRGVQVGLFCEDYPVLRDRQISKIKREFPQALGSVRGTQDEGLGFHLRPRYGGGSILLRNLDDPSKYQSAEFAAIGVDELTKNPYGTFDILRGSLRWPGVDMARFVAATNPGSIGHLWVKQLWLDREYPEELEPQAGQFAFVKALPADNPHLDQDYWDTLHTLPDKLQQAWVYGNWDMFEGQAFDEWRREHHVVEPFTVPDSWRRWRAVDWGYRQPYCCLWLTQDPDSRRVYVYNEDYQTGLTDKGQAERIKEKTRGDKIRITLADPSMWTKKSYEDRLTSSAEEYQKAGVRLTQADNDRIRGLRRVREFLADAEDGRPGIQVFSTCRNLIRTLPALPHDEHNPEDVDSDAEDHGYDALRYGLTWKIRGPRRKPKPGGDQLAAARHGRSKIARLPKELREDEWTRLAIYGS